MIETLAELGETDGAEFGVASATLLAVCGPEAAALTCGDGDGEDILLTCCLWEVTISVLLKMTEVKNFRIVLRWQVDGRGLKGSKGNAPVLLNSH